MALAPQCRLGPYEILGPLGAGGMGEVYRARDTRLERIVAIKILPARVAGREDSRQRFEREARAVSSLNHPHICNLYDIGREGETGYLVMEYLEGETLAARLAKGALPVPEALRCGAQISEALEQAHRKGVIHRDLKPGNVMLTKAGAKLLDFGLAKLREPDRVAGGSLAPTVTQPVTAEGTLVGTLQYMAPEQLEGKEADARTDIFALGALLYEMVTGRKAFEGKSQASVISAIMSSEPPPVATLQPMAPPALEHVVTKCLAKDADGRWQSAADVAAELKWIAEGGSQTGLPAVRRAARERLGWAVAGLLLAMVAMLGVIQLRPTPPRERTVRFQLSLPHGVTLRVLDYPVVSPDGERIAFGGQRAGGGSQLWVHTLRSNSARPMPGTEEAYLPFWSPDSRSVGFFSLVEGKLKKVVLVGGGPQTVCDVPHWGVGGAWSREGIVVFALLTGAPLYQVSAAGGQPKPLTVLDKSRGEIGHAAPQFLPDGRHFLYLARCERRQDNAIYVGSLDGKPPRRLLAGDSTAVYAPPGYLLFVRGQTLLAQPFHPGKLRLDGQPAAAAEAVGAPTVNVFGGQFSVSENGVLAVQHGWAGETQLAWYDRAGRRLAQVGEPHVDTNPALAPDEKRVAVGRLDPQTNTRDIWLLDLGRGTSTRFTFDPSDDFNPMWSPDGSRIAFTSDRKGVRNLYHKAASGVGRDELLLETGFHKSVEHWSRDGRFILFNEVAVSGSGMDVWALPVGGRAAGPPFRVIEGPEAWDDQGQVAPDGRWIVYRSNESGRFEVYVQGFPPTGGKWQISTAGGDEPKWRDDGQELFYLEGNNMMAVEVQPSRTPFEAGVPRKLFEAPLVSEIRRNRYLVSRDGQKFLLLTPAARDSRPISVILNWTAALRAP